MDKKRPVLFFLRQFRQRIGARWLIVFGGEQIRISVDGLREHKTRSFLTMLGIIFGVAAVISMLAIGEGARRKTMAQIQSFGLQNVIARNDLDKLDNSEPGILLNDQDVQAIQNVLPTIEMIVPVIESSSEASHGIRFSAVTITGTEPDYFQLMNLQVEKGGYFSYRDNQYHQRVCVLGKNVAKKLFLAEPALGQKIKIERQWFTVIGVLRYQPVSTAGNIELDLNDHIYIPIQSIRMRFERDPSGPDIDQIIARIQEAKYVVSSAEFIEQILLRRHNGIKNFSLIVPEQLLRQSEETQKIFNIVMGAIAGISLLVGGIGIMNIMLASVLERTREIGIRRSLGATQRNIRDQFLVEALILSLLGGVIGILFGYLLTIVVTIYSDWETAVSAWSVILAFGVSSAVGVLFGYFPAKKAARLDPIEALRYE
jgi:putative ABC transport system permease protein